MNFFVLIDPSKINVKMLMWIVGILAVIVIWAGFSGNEEDEKFLDQQSKMSLVIDPQRKLPIIDLDIDNPIRKKEFHTAVLGKEFLVKGTEVTLVSVKKNPRGRSTDIYEFDYLLSSAVVNSKCVEKIQAALNSGEYAQKPLDLSAECQSYDSPFSSSFSTNEPLSESSLKKACSEGARCSSCTFIMDSGTPLGQCVPKDILYVDESSVITTQSKKSINVQYRVKDKLAYKN